MTDQLEGFRVAILATDLFEESELIEPRKALDEAGAKTVVSLRTPEKFKASSTVRIRARSRSTKLSPTLIQKPSTQFYFREEQERRGPPEFGVGAGVCPPHRPDSPPSRGHLPWWLAVDLCSSRQGTPYDQLPRHSGRFPQGRGFLDSQEVVHEGNSVTSRKPSNIPRFNEEIIDVFSSITPEPAKPPDRRTRMQNSHFPRVTGGAASRRRLRSHSAAWGCGFLCYHEVDPMPLTVPMFTLRDYDKRDFDLLFELDRLCFEPGIAYSRRTCEFHRAARRTPSCQSAEAFR